MKIAVVGTGYVGLTTGVCLAYLGLDVTCVDADEAKIAALRDGRPPFFEPGLAELLRTVTLRFTTRYADAIPQADVVFIAVPTPASDTGAPDLQFLRAAAQGIAENLGDRFLVIATKSTVPVGTGADLGRQIAATGKHDFAVASNPEFLRQGSALHDTFFPERIVIGADDRRALEILGALYRPLVEQSFPPPAPLHRPAERRAVPTITADLASAELTKYAANAFLATKISFINEIAALCERVGADVELVARAMGLDPRIGARYLQPGLGWGGSCLGKDTAALEIAAAQHSLDLPIVHAARVVNDRRRARVIDLLSRELGGLEGRNVGILGLAFKPQTDDVRDAPAVDVAQRLLARGARVRAHDPIAQVPGIARAETVEAAAADADALVLATEWPEYRALDWAALAKVMRGRVVLDGRSFLPRREIEAAGLRYLLV